MEISIRNIALIDSLRVEFGQGLNVLTGETGAGKSIVVDSVNLSLGARAGKELIRSGAEKATVQALFDARHNGAIRALAEELGFELEDDLITVTRELSTAGRSVCRVNGSVLPISQLRRITEQLVDVHGQHEHQALMNPQKHLAFLDAFGDDKHRALMADVAARHAAYQEVRRERDRLSLNASERERRVDMLTYQVNEIEAVRPKENEDAKLERKNRLYENAEKLASRVETAYEYVYAKEGRALSAQEALRRSADALRAVAGIDEKLDALQARLEEMYYAVQDIGYELQDARDGLEYDPAQAERTADRLNELKKLKRKYGPELSDVLAFVQNAKTELSELSEGDDRLVELKKREDKLIAELKRACDALTVSRTALAGRLTESLLGQLKDLGMGKTRFEVRFAKRSEAEGRYSPNGVDAVEFMLSPNPGEPLKPLAAIASGGELSRIMLALKAIAADAEGVDCMIFDEIDTGVSGRMAQTVGEKMASIGKRRQVICVTHLPQIAALANRHYVVEKTVVDNRTGSGVRLLDKDGRIEELARMVGGAGDAESGIRHATHMLEAAQALIAGE